MAGRAARAKRFPPSPAIDGEFSVSRYLLHLARGAFVRTRTPIARPRPTVGPGEVGVTWIGHATVLLDLDGTTVLTDPVLSNRLFFVKRLVAPGLPAGGLPPPDVVLVSHGHHDHLDLPTHRRIAHSGAVVVAARGLADLLRPMGYGRVVELSWGEEFRWKEIRILAVEVNHWGARGLFPDGRGYTGFIVSGRSGSVFFPGDTAYTPLFRVYGQRQPIDIALLPIGAYKPDSFRRVHMNPEDALQAFLDLRARWLVPIHWGTFVLSYEPPDEPPRWIRELAHARGLAERLVLLEHGEARVLRTRV
jgi:L-ascorbate metabolism protein UlaG (beta-lactamase superfamily)